MVVGATGIVNCGYGDKAPPKNNLTISRPLCTNLQLFLNQKTLTVVILQLIFSSLRKAVSWHILNEI